jgi:uncharacterized protein YndB with AHSA1/START domain
MSTTVAAEHVPERIEQEILVQASCERVWKVLTVPRYLREWYAFDGAELDPRSGGAAHFYWKEHGTFHARIVQAEPPHTLSFHFADLTPDEQPRAGNATLVEFTLTTEGEATRLRVVQSGFSNLKVSSEAQREHAENSALAWTNGLEALRTLAESQ